MTDDGTDDGTDQRISAVEIVLIAGTLGLIGALLLMVLAAVW